MIFIDYLLDQFEKGRRLRNQSYRGRYAPSPTGPLHLGNLRTALFSWLRARLSQGTWSLRIDDLDAPRNCPGAVESFKRDLLWLGLDWDGPWIFQSERRGLYRLAIASLRRKKKLYACRCSRKEILANAIAPREEAAIYPGTCRTLGLSWGWYNQRLPSIRLRVENEFSTNCGDIILRRSDGYIAYHLATVVDDLTLGINEVVRGYDLKSSLPSQLALIKELNQEPLTYKYIPLLLDEYGQKLSKRKGGLGIEYLQENGITSEELIGQFAAQFRLIPLGSKLSAKELLSEISVNQIHFSKLFANHINA